MMAEQVILGESAVSIVLILAILVISITRRDMLLAEKNQLVLVENIRKVRMVVLLLLVSLWVYILGEVSVVGVDIERLSIDSQKVHHYAEIIHLALLIIGFTMGLQILAAMMEDSG
jgi:hypothetical protein